MSRKETPKAYVCGSNKHMEERLARSLEGLEVAGLAMEGDDGVALRFFDDVEVLDEVLGHKGRIIRAMKSMRVFSGIMNDTANFACSEGLPSVTNARGNALEKEHGAGINVFVVLRIELKIARKEAWHPIDSIINQLDAVVGRDKFALLVLGTAAVVGRVRMVSAAVFAQAECMAIPFHGFGNILVKDRAGHAKNLEATLTDRVLKELCGNRGLNGAAFAEVE
jgi:hypothetical protein